MMAWRAAGTVMLWLGIMVPAKAFAQNVQRGTLAGTVRRALDSLPVLSASVTLDSTGASVTTDTAGNFAIRAAPAGDHALHVRRTGYLPTVIRARVFAESTAHVVLYLQSAAQPMMTVEVAGRRVTVPSRFAEVAERVKLNHGVLFTAQEINPENRTRDVLQRVAGVNVNDRSVTFARCQDTGGLPSAFEHSGTEIAHVQVYVDGMRMTGSGRGDVNDILNSVTPASIQLMEVYTGIGRIPAEYLADACAVIAIWTKAY